MLRTVESHIRFKAILIYLIIAAISGGMIFYIYYLRDSIDTYKSNIEEYNAEIIQVDSLIQYINNTQQEANQYVTTRRTAHLRQFRKNLNTLEFHLDSLAEQGNEPLLNELITEINELLKEKANIISRLNRQFNIQHTIPDSISDILNSYEPVIQTDSILISTVVQDTTFHIPPPPKRNFFQKIFTSPKEQQDTIFTISTIQTDTLLIRNQTDSIPILSEISNYTQQLKQEYQERLTSIQQQVNQLILSDHKISTRISELLLDLYGNSIRTILGKIEQQEDKIRHTNSLSMLTGGIALGLILLFIILIFNDVNKGLRNRKALEIANERIRQTMESRHKLLLSVSHDIKTPLNSILGHLELNEKGATFTQDKVNAMKHAGEHILSLLYNLLEFSGLEQGALKAAPGPFKLYDLCMETVDICLPLAKKKELQFIPRFYFEKTLTLCSDRLKLKQIIINILSNSIKYTNKGEVTFQVDYKDQNIIISISDTGVGIEKEQIEKLFRPFTRLENQANTTEGTGIGMFVVKGLTELLQGDIRMESEPGKGTKTTITIPADERVPEESQSIRKVLLIDDNLSFMTLLKDMFSHLRYEVACCNSMQEFENRIEQLPLYDILFTDLEMGAISGTDILQRTRESGNNIPVIVMTGRTDFSYEEALRLGFTNYIPKPISLPALKSFLGGKEPERTSASGFQTLEEMFGNDQEVIREILNTFIDSTFIHIGNLQEAIEKDDFREAQRICHTMLPMFMQIGGGEAVELLKKMDLRRNDPAENHPEWKKEMETLILATGDLIVKIEENYPDISSPIL